jgi:hypothetical protein
MSLATRRAWLAPAERICATSSRSVWRWAVGGVAGGELRGLHLDRAPRLEHVRERDLLGVERVVEHLREDGGVDRVQARAAAGLDIEDSERRQAAVRLAHAAAARAELAHDLHFARDDVARAELLALDQREDVARDLGGEGLALEAGQDRKGTHGNFQSAELDGAAIYTIILNMSNRLDKIGVDWTTRARHGHCFTSNL